MRISVFLLLLANLLLFAWTHAYLGMPANADAHRIEQQLLPEKVTVVARGQPARANGKKDAAAKTEKLETVEPVAEKSAAESCQLWSDLASADADQIERLLAERFAAFKAKRETTGETSGYWVHIPPLASKDEASRKTAELQQLGIQEFFVVPTGANALAISLGLYRNQEAARTRLESLRTKGVRSAKIGERKGKSALSTLEIRGPEAQAVALREAIVALSPKASPAACPAGESTP